MMDGRTDERTNICNCRVAFATEKIFGRENNVDCHLFRVQLSTISKM